MNIYAHQYVCVRTYTYIRIYMHTYIHTYINTYIHRRCAYICCKRYISESVDGRIQAVQPQLLWLRFQVRFLAILHLNIVWRHCMYVCTYICMKCMYVCMPMMVMCFSFSSVVPFRLATQFPDLVNIEMSRLSPISYSFQTSVLAEAITCGILTHTGS